MKEKRIKLIAGKGGKNRIETLSGFAGTECHDTIDLIMGGIDNAKPIGSGDTDEMYRMPESDVSITDL